MKNEFCQIFETELKKKLSERARSTIDEIRILLNCFKFYDLDYIGIIDKIQWVRGILKTGLTGFNEDDLLSIFLCYDKNNSGFIDYKNFSNYLYGREDLNPLPKESNINVFETYNNINNKNIIYNNLNNNININNINNINSNINGNIKNNKYYNNNQNINYNNKLLKQQNISKDIMRSYYESLLLKFRKKINTNNGFTFYIFAQKLKSYEINKMIKVSDLIQIFKEMEFDFTEKEVRNFFNMLDNKIINYVFYNDILNTIKGEMNENRKNNLLNIFNILDENKEGKISVNYLKNIYKNNLKYHPDVIKGIKSADIIYNQFCQKLDIFLNINNIINNDITKEQFIDYYSGISSSIQDDIYFQDILNGIFDLNKIFNNNKNNKLKNNINNNINYKGKANNSIDYNKIFKNELNNIGINSYFDYINNYNKYNYSIPYKKQNKYVSKSQSSPNIITQKYAQKPYYNNNNKIKNNLLDNHFYSLSNDNDNKNNNNNNGNNIVGNNRYYNNEGKKINLNNIISISDPYYRPRITPGNKGRKIFKKIIYNPITKQVLFANDHHNEEQYIKITKENKINSPMTRYKNNIFLFNEEKYNQKQLLELFNKFRKEIIKKGKSSIFTLQKILSEFNSNNNPNLISFDDFHILFQKLNINNINSDEIKKIFGIFDQENTGYINYDNFLKNLVGNMGRKRQSFVRKLYESFNKDQNGNIFSLDLKTIFNASKYNDILGGKKSKEDIYYNFVENLDIFLNYRNKLYNKDISDIINYNDFLRFFDQISMYINSDEIFENYINSCWNININNNLDSKDNYYTHRNYNRNFKNTMIRTGSQIINW